MNGYNFTERVRTALAYAREEAARLDHDYVGTEHELLGLLREGEGVASVMLENLNAPLDEVRSRIESVIKRGKSGPTGPDLPYTSRAKKVLELAMSEARDGIYTYVGTEHLLLGVMREERGIGAQVLASFGLTVDALREEMRRILGPAPQASSRPSSPLPTNLQPSGMRVEFIQLRGGVPPRVDAAIAEARQVAARAGAARLEGLHVAIGLLVHRQGVAIAAIERMGGDVPRLLADLQARLPASGSSATAEVIPIAHDFARVIDAAHREQEAWHASTMATHHLLLALLETCPDVAEPFGAQGVTAERLRIEAGRIVG